MLKWELLDDISYCFVIQWTLNNTMSCLGKTKKVSLEKFRKIDGPIIDTRSPKEYTKGHWPGSINIPLFENKEREIIGKIYKEEGSSVASLEGLKFIIPKLKSLKNKLTEIVLKYKHEHDYTNKVKIRVYCARGGMRSKSLTWFSNLFEINAVQLKGGYKNYRNWALNQFEKKWPIKLLGGKTGSAKTKILVELSKNTISIVDLEGLANHRGSSFGGLGLPKQPTNEHFENLIAEELEQYKDNKNKPIWIEDESPNIGNCRIPNGLIKQMKNADLIEIKKSRNERIFELTSVYSNNNKEELKSATIRISKRLGPQRTQKAIDAIEREDWENVCIALLDYYDKCYDFQLEKVEKIKSIDLSGLNENEACLKLIETGLIY